MNYNVPFPDIRGTVEMIVENTSILDIHTHVYDAPFGDLLLWGVDELITYHYLVAEFFRAAPMEYDQFWAMPKKEQANRIWQALFLERSPISEACRGVLTTLQAYGLDLTSRSLNEYRDFFASTKVEDHINRVFRIANLQAVVMTNDPFDATERPVWEKGASLDPRFKAALRMDPILMNWENASKSLASWGYAVSSKLDDQTFRETRRFLEDWIRRINPEYMAVSLTPDFRYPDDSPSTALLDECILPVAREHGLPFAMMIGVKRQVNPSLRLAGDSVGKSDVGSVERICVKFPENKFLTTMLSRENQHELCVTARKFPNLMLFGCWWFLNNPSIIEEMTRERFELLGLSVIPQHSDARVLDQVIYKWKHSRKIISGILSAKYEDLVRTGWTLTGSEIERDVRMIFGGNYRRFVHGE